LKQFDEIIEGLNELESKRKLELANDSAVPLAILTVLSGFWFSLAEGLQFPLSKDMFIVTVLLLLSGAFIAYSSWLFWQAHVGNEYKAAASAFDLHAYRIELTEWGRREARSDEEVEMAWDEYFRGVLVENATHNAKVNERRSATIIKQKQMLAVALIVLSITGISTLWIEI
jgi:hypothetical protein